MHEVTVEFLTVNLRDVVKSSAYNLAGDRESGIRLEIPHHLMQNFKALNAASYKLKMKFPQCKRNIKYDDERCDLVLDFCTDDKSRWKKLKPEQAREMQREGEAEAMSTSDMSELLDGGGQEKEDEDTFVGADDGDN